MKFQLPQPIGPDWKLWAKRLLDYLNTTRSQLAHYVAGDSAAHDGVLLYDSNGYPVISKSGQFKQVLVKGGCGQFTCTISQTAAAADTAYAIPFNLASATHGLSINSSDSTRIDVEDGGLLRISVIAQAHSTSSATLCLWVQLNGVNGYAVRKTVLGDDVVAHKQLVHVNSGHYIKVFYSVSNTALTLPFTSGAAPVPSTPAARMSIYRVYK